MGERERPIPARVRVMASIIATPRGARSYAHWTGDPMVYSIAAGNLLGAGLVRERRHRDHTRDHVATPAGVAWLRQQEAAHHG